MRPPHGDTWREEKRQKVEKINTPEASGASWGANNREPGAACGALTVRTEVLTLPLRSSVSVCGSPCALGGLCLLHRSAAARRSSACAHTHPDRTCTRGQCAEAPCKNSPFEEADCVCLCAPRLWFMHFNFVTVSVKAVKLTGMWINFHSCSIWMIFYLLRGKESNLFVWKQKKKIFLLQRFFFFFFSRCKYLLRPWRAHWRGINSSTELRPDSAWLRVLLHSSATFSWLHGCDLGTCWSAGCTCWCNLSPSADQTGTEWMWISIRMSLRNKTCGEAGGHQTGREESAAAERWMTWAAGLTNQDTEQLEENLSRKTEGMWPMNTNWPEGRKKESKPKHRQPENWGKNWYGKPLVTIINNPK